MIEGTLDYFLGISKKIVHSDSPKEVKSYLKSRSKTKSLNHNYPFSLNLDQIQDKSHISKISERSFQRNRAFSRMADAYEMQVARKKNSFKASEILHTTSSRSYKPLHRQTVSVTESGLEKNLTTCPTLTFTTLEDLTPTRQNTSRRTDTVETFVSTQTGFIDVNPDCVVARYIRDSFKDPDLSYLKKKVNRRSVINLTQRLGDLKSTTQPEYSKNHGTMLSCELWGNKRRIECRQQIQNINNLTKAIGQANRERYPSLHDTLLENDKVLTMEGDLDSNASTKATINMLKANSQNRGKSLVELKRLRAIPAHVIRHETESISSNYMVTERKRCARGKMGSAMIRPQYDDYQSLGSNNSMSYNTIIIRKKTSKGIK